MPRVLPTDVTAPVVSLSAVTRLRRVSAARGGGVPTACVGVCRRYSGDPLNAVGARTVVGGGRRVGSGRCRRVSSSETRTVHSADSDRDQRGARHTDDKH
jgi:hypothetical protein